MAETREEKIRRIAKNTRQAREGTTPDAGLHAFAAEWDPEWWEAYSMDTWGFFSPDRPRHLDQKTREMVVCGLLAFRNRPIEAIYLHSKNAMKHGASINDLVEVYELALIPGGGPARNNGLKALRRIVQEEDVGRPQERSWLPPEKKKATNGGKTKPESREERIRRIREKIHSDNGYLDEAIDFGIELDLDYFDMYSQLHWGFFQEKFGHLEPVQRELIVMAIMAYRGMREELYEHAQKALRLGATMEQILEGFEVSVSPGGLPVLHEGLRALKRIHDEK
jgi:alkylhydroperoxidase/carboxymuconolactone decarboxylase family protein YurZ